MSFDSVKRRYLHPFFTAWLLITGLGLPLLTPLLRGTAVPCTHDGHLHYHRVAALRYAWENGLYFSRWLPDLAFGYGYPFFVYREPAPLYAVLWPHLLGLPLPAASNLFYALTILTCGWFTFLWVRDVLGEWAGLVAAMAYMTAPYVLLDALVRGNAPESLALPLFPLLLWAGRRWLLTARRRYLLVGVGGLALLALSHNISLLIFTPTLLLYLLFLAWLHRLPWSLALIRPILLLGFGLGGTLFYTGGALLEMDAVTLEQSTSTRNNDFRFNFATLGEIVAPVSAEDPSLVNPPLPFRLGWVPLALAVVGLGQMAYFGLAPKLFAKGFLTQRRKDAEMKQLAAGGENGCREQWGHVVLMVVGTAVYLAVSLPLSRPLWEKLPLVDFIQFPWRFIGRAALPLAFLAGLPFATPPMPSRRRSPYLPFLLLLALSLLFLETLPNLYPNVCTEAPFPTINTVHTYEHDTGLVGVDPEGSYFPRTVGKRPSASPLEGDYLAGQTPQRFDLTMLPEGAVVETAVYTPMHATLRLTTPTPFTMRYLSFAFPGWSATIDGQPVAITPGDPDGLITFAVPAGTHTLTVQWGWTPLRLALTGLSGFTLLALSVVLWRKPKALFPAPSPSNESSRLAQSGSRNQPLWWWGLLLAGLLLSFKLWSDRVDTPWRRTAPPPVQEIVGLRAGEMRLEGFNFSRRTVGSGEMLQVDMAWTAVSPPSADYQTNIWLVGSDGLTWSDRDTQRPRAYEDAPPTRLWLPGQWGWDSRELVVLPGTPPGEYDLTLILFDRETRQPLTLYDDTGAVIGPEAVIGHITVTWPSEPVEMVPVQPLQSRLPGLTLGGYAQDRETAVPGDPLLLTLFWTREAGQPPASLNLQLRDAGGTAVHTWISALIRADFDPATWPVGQQVRGQYWLRLPARLDSGTYRLLVNNIALGSLNLTAPERLLTPREMATAVSVPFTLPDNTPWATLAGYTLTADPSTLSLTLLWQAEAETAVAYRVFVHLVAADGALLAQSDAEPATWSRPTTGWMPGEYILDSHTLSLPTTLPATLPPSSYTLRLGFYDPDTGQRLSTDSGEFVVIPWP